MAPTWALPLPFVHPTQTRLTLWGDPATAGHGSLCSQWEGYGG